MVVDVNHTKIGSMKTLGAPVKFSTTPGGVHRSAPTFGEHTEEILLEYGFQPAEIERSRLQASFRSREAPRFSLDRCIQSYPKFSHRNIPAWQCGFGKRLL